MHTLLVELGDPQCGDITRVGGKAANLNWLLRRGFRVAPAFVFLPDLFLSLMGDPKIQERINSLNSETDLNRAFKTGCQLREIISSSAAAVLIEKELKGCERFDSEKNYAVRSSVSDEDGERTSFAGQMDTFLYVKGISSIAQKTVECFESAFSERAIAYRIQNKYKFDIRMCVIIQEMIDTDRAGVAFSANPTTGNRKEILISANFGLGEGVVSGHCECDEYTVERDSLDICKTVREKDFQFIHAKDGGTEIIALDKDKSRMAALADDEIRSIAVHVKRISKLKGCPQDIEWGYSNGQLYFFQTRPITKLPEVQTQNIVFDNSNIQESYCGVTTPLTYSFASDAYFNVYSQLMRVMNFSEKQIERHSERHRNMLGFARGRIYYNINSWYEGLLLLPSFGKNKEDMEKMMGVTEPVDFVKGQKLTAIQKIARVPGMIILLARLLSKFRKMSRLAAEFKNWFESEYRKFSRSELQTLSSSELHRQISKMKATFLSQWGIPIVNDFYVMMMNGRVTRALKDIEMESELPSLMAVENLESTEPTKFLLHLADIIRARPQTSQFITQSEATPATYDTLSIHDPDIHAKIENYIELYGDRCVGELKLESISMREDPSFVLQVLKSYLERADLTLQSFLDRETSSRDAAEERVLNKILEKRGRFKARKFRRNIVSLRNAVRYRESMRLARTRVFGLFRGVYLELGSRFVFSGQLNDTRDIFYLTEDEITQVFSGKTLHRNFKGLVELRKREFSEYQKEELPNHFRYLVPESSIKETARPQSDTSQELRGIGCFPGIVRTRVKLVSTPKAGVNLKGKILCTVRTDPGWAPLFASIDGLIVERGSTLSHSAIVAREMGIPAIVGVPNITKILNDEELIEMDGESGKLSRMEGSCTV